MSQVTIRHAREADIPSVVRLQHQMMDYHEALDPRFAHRDDVSEGFAKWVGELIAKDDAAVIVAETDGQVVGYTIGLHQQSPALDPPDHGFVSDICVEAECRQRGVGAALFAKLKEWFRSRGLTVAWANVACENPVSQRFWRGQGGTDWQDILHFDLREGC